MKCRLLLILIMMFGCQGTAVATEPTETLSIEELEKKVKRLQSKVRQLENEQTATDTEISQLHEAIRRAGAALIFFAIFCAWWAKTTGRSALLWFIMGLLFHVFTGIALLMKTESRA